MSAFCIQFQAMTQIELYILLNLNQFIAQACNVYKTVDDINKMSPQKRKLFIIYNNCISVECFHCSPNV